MPRPSRSLQNISPCSRAWLSRQYRDPYVKGRLNIPLAYRSPSAFKLIEIDAQWNHFLMKPHVNAVVDLGAAPGGWSQVVAGKLGWGVRGERDGARLKVKGFGYGENGQRLVERYGTWSGPKLGAVVNGQVDGGDSEAEGKRMNVVEEQEQEEFDPLSVQDKDNDSANRPRGRGTIVAVDLLPMKPIHGVLDVQADFLKPETNDLIHGLLSIKGNPGGKADIILSDMAVNSPGNETADVDSSLEICESVYNFASQHLRTAETIGKRRGGVLLMKYFTHPLLQTFHKFQLHPNFNDVRIVKPRSSRSESKEAYFLCQGWKGLY